MVVHQSGVTIKEAAGILGVSEAAVRQRLLRGTLTSTRQNGRVFVLLPEDTSGDTVDDTITTPDDTPDDTVTDPINRPLVATLRDEVAFLRQQVDIKDRQISELHIMLQTAQRQLPANVRDAPHPPEQAADDESRTTSGDTSHSASQRESEALQPLRPWWRRLFGLE